MKKALQVVVLASLLTSFSAFAHHPAEDIIDPETWEMIDQNLEDADSPHLDMVFSDMGR
jgi:phage shock protein A